MFPFEGEIEVDESYFGGTRKGQRGRGAAGKVPVFELLKRGRKVYAKVIPDAKTDRLMPIIRNTVKPDSIVYTDAFRSYDALDVSEFGHMRINHSELFADKCAIISMESRISGSKQRGICVNLMGCKKAL